MKSSFEIAGPHDDHDEYWDDEDESDDDDDEEEGNHEENVDDTQEANGGRKVRANGRSTKNGQKQKKAKMKRMKVSTQRDYRGAVSLHMLYLSPRARGICCISTIVCFLVVGVVYLVVPHSGTTSSNSAEYQAGYEAAGSGGSGDFESTCTVHTTKEPFSEWMHHIKKANATDLCREEVGTTTGCCTLTHFCFDRGTTDSKLSIFYAISMIISFT